MPGRREGDRLLFLDFDGVLNSSRSMGFRKECKLCGGLCWFDPKAIARLNTVLERTGAMIVVSSSWRVGRKLTELREILHGHGVTEFTVVAATPTPFTLLEKTGQLLTTAVTRGEEIAAWLKLREGYRTPRSWAIVDDDPSMAPVAHRHVKTDWTEGLLDEHVEKLCALLLEEMVPARTEAGDEP